MANLKKREIIILVIAALFVLLFAGYKYLLPHLASEKVKTSADSVKIETVTSELTRDLNINKLSDYDKYVVIRAGVDSGNNPFLKKDIYRAWLAKDGTANSALAKIIYSGYVDSGKNKMAVIDGLEYRVGEQLAEEGYVLKKITPSKVLIFDKRTGSSLEIPIQE
jgi:hypothetical protein